MRISTAQMQSQAVRSMQERQSTIAYTQQQLATGKRILTPSDDVTGSTRALALQQGVDMQKQYQVNADVAEGRLATEENVLAQTVNVLQRARELAIQGNNTTLTAESRAMLASEVRENLKEVLSLANTIDDSTGEYIFAGYNVATAPFTETENPPGSGLFDYAYTGDSGQRNIQIGATRQVPVGDPGDEVFMNVPLSGGGTQNVFETLEQLAISLETNAPDPAAPDDILKAIEYMATFSARVGARQNAIESHRGFSEDMQLEAERRLSKVQDLDFAEAISRLNLEMAGLEASQLSFSRIQNLSLFNYL